MQIILPQSDLNIKTVQNIEFYFKKVQFYNCSETRAFR